MASSEQKLAHHVQRLACPLHISSNDDIANAVEFNKIQAATGPY